MSLTKEQRDALPPSDFAVPNKKLIPIHDVPHTKMAWTSIESAKNLTDEERTDAKKNTIAKAHQLGIDCSEWKKDIESNYEDEALDESEENVIGPIRGESIAMQFDAMSISIPDDNKLHPNKTPFSGILTRVDEPSDNPIGGSAGKRVILPKLIAESSLSSLLCMSIDFTENLDGHDSQRKIGVITEATIEGNAILIKGFFYGADFPQEVKRIQAEKSLLGFSYEAQVKIRSMNDDPLVIQSCIFTGAAVLYKNKAGYVTTALNAKAEKLKMSDEILNMLKDMKNNFDVLQAGVDKNATQIASLIENEKAIQDAKDAELKAAKKDDENKEINELKNLLASMQTKLTDLETKNFEAAEAATRKTQETKRELPDSARTLLAKAGIAESNSKYDVATIDNALSKLTQLSDPDRIKFKLQLRQSGQL